MFEEGPKTKRVPLLVATQMREIEAQVRVCQLCKLYRTRTNGVPGEGDYQAEIMFIGEGPGYHEDRQGRPFVGNAGEFLNELLGIAGLSRSSVFITNVVKSRPPNNRDPEPDEIKACSFYLDKQIELINPRIIVTLGRFSMSRFFPGERISQIHGMARMVDGRMCVSMYHPAAGLHQASLADVIRSDFRKLPLFIDQARKLLAHHASPEPIAPEVIEPAEAEEPEMVMQAPVAQQAVEVQEQAVAPEPEVVLEQPESQAVTLQESAVSYAAEKQTDAPPNFLDHVVAVPQEQAPGVEPAPAPRKKRTSKAKSDSGYKQLNFFDL